MVTEQQEKWLKRTGEMFFRYGIKSLTMDDVARELGISKKTLYTFVENKDDLVCKVIERYIEDDRQLCEVQFKQAANAIEEMFIVIETNAQQMEQMKSNVIFDLQKYHRDAWEKMERFQHGFLYEVVRANLERGVAEGLYRTDFDIDIVTRLHIAASFQLFDESFFPAPSYKKDHVFREYLMHYLHGIVSEKGLKLIKEKFSLYAQ